MIHELVLIHRPGSERFAFVDHELSQQFAENSEAAAHWFSFKTCMRHIVIGDHDLLAAAESERRETDEFFVGADAHRFLLEVICGLHSPLIGETEVYGQFKNAVSSYTWLAHPFSTQLQRFFRLLFEDAKRVRQAHLEDLGSQSYGSILRREIKVHRALKGSAKVHFIGAGHLVQEILPWISKDGTEVHVHCRSPEKAAKELGALVPTRQIHSFEDKAELMDADVLVVAAPVSAEWIRQWLPADVSLKLITDLRSDSGTDSVAAALEATTLEATASGACSVMCLNELFERIASNQAHLEARKRAALHAIDIAVNERSRHVEYRPFGWEDVCA